MAANHTPGKKNPEISAEEAFGIVLKRIRRERGLSPEELGFETGYHRTYIGQLERGEKSPSLRTLFNLCSTLKKKPSQIIKAVEQQAHATN